MEIQLVEKILETEKEAKIIVDSARANSDALVQQERLSCDQNAKKVLEKNLLENNKTLGDLEASYAKQLKELGESLLKENFDSEIIEKASDLIVKAVIE